MDARDAVGSQPYTIHYEILDGQKKRIVRNFYTAWAKPTNYAFYDSSEESLEESVPSEASYFYLPLPPKAEILRVWSEQVVDIAFYAYYRAERPIYVTNSDSPEKETYLYNCYDDEIEWYYFRPVNHQVLEQQQRAIRIAWQCRIVRERRRKARSLPETERSVRVISPDLYAEKVSLLEKVETTENTSYDSELNFFEVSPGEDLPVQLVDHTNPHNTLPVTMEAIYYREREETSSLTYILDGSQYGSDMLSRKSGRLHLDDLPQGTHRVQFRSPSPVRLFINRLPLSPDPTQVAPILWKRRTSYLLRRQQPIVVTMQKESYRPKRLNVLVYYGSAEVPMIRARIMGAAGSRPASSHTATQRTFYIRAWKPLASFDIVEGTWYSKKQRLTLTLGEDLGPGEYRIRFDMRSRSKALLRFLIMEDTPYPITSRHAAALNLVGPGRLKLQLKSQEVPINRPQDIPRYLISKRLNYQGEQLVEQIPLASDSSQAVAEVDLSIPPGLHTYRFLSPGDVGWDARFYVDRYPEMIPGKYRYPGSDSPARPSQTPTWTTVSTQTLYDQAIRDYRRKALRQSELKLKELTNRTDLRLDLRDNLLYWQGACALAQGRAAEARRFFQRVIERYPGSNKVPDARNKLSFLRQGQSTKVAGPTTSLTSPVMDRFSYVRVEPETSLLRYYRTLTNGRLIPVVVNFTGSTSSYRRILKLTSRMQLPEKPIAPPKPYVIYYEILSTAGKLLSQGAEELIPTGATIHDRYVPRGYPGVPSEGAGFYIHLPDQPGKLRVWTDNGKVAIALYERRPEYVRKTYIPEDSLGSSTVSVLDASHSREWYPLRPDNHRELFLADRLVKIRSQKLIIKERAVATEAEPVGLWSTIAPDVYRSELKVLEPITSTDKDDALNVVPFLPYQQSMTFVPDSRESSKVRTYYSLKSEEPVILSLYKKDREPLTLNVVAYVDAPPPSRLPLKVAITPVSTVSEMPVVSGSYTTYERIYYLKNEPSKEAENVLLTSGSRAPGAPILSAPQRFVVTFNDDLPAGKYMVRFESPTSSGGLLRFFVPESPSFALKPGQSAWLNLLGPGDFRATIVQQEHPAMLRVIQFTEAGEIKTEEIPLAVPDDGVVSSFQRPFSAGAVTVQIENIGSNRIALEFFTTRTTGASATGAEWARTRPSLGTYAYYPCSSDEGLEIVLPGGSQGSRTLRVTARLPFKAGDQTPRRGEVVYRLFNSKGMAIATGRFAVEATRSNDAFYAPREFQSDIPSDAVYRYIELPRTIKRLTFESEAEVHLRFHQRAPTAERITYVPEDRASRKGLRLRLGSPSGSGWEVLTPANRNQLVNQDKMVKIRTQQKWIAPREEVTEPTTKIALTLAPDNYEERVAILEPLLSVEPSEVKSSRTTYCRLPWNSSIQLKVVNHDLPTGVMPTNIRLFYRSLPSLTRTGNRLSNIAITLFVDGQRFAEFPILSPQGELIVPPIRPGLHTFRLEAQSPYAIRDELEVFVNQLPANLVAASIWKRRTAYTLSPENPLVVSIEKSSFDQMTLNVVVYHDNEEANIPDRFAVLVTIDGGNRPLASYQAATQYTALIRKFDIQNQPSSGFYINKEGIRPGQARSFFIPLFDDMPPGQHQIRLRLLSGKSAKVRFFIMDDARNKIQFQRESTETIPG